MHIYNKIYVFSLTICYTFRRLVRHPYAEVYCMRKTITIVWGIQ
jgi:hypothetical protein